MVTSRTTADELNTEKRSISKDIRGVTTRLKKKRKVSRTDAKASIVDRNADSECSLETTVDTFSDSGNTCSQQLLTANDIDGADALLSIIYR